MNQHALVPRTVRGGAYLLIFGALQFIAGMILVQSQYSGYSLRDNYISDLGGASSPWALVFDGSVIILGICAIFGILIVWSAFEPGRARGVGLTFVLIGGIGAVGVGVFPETTPVLNGGMHTIVSFIAFSGAGIGITAASFSMGGSSRWSAQRPLTLACGVVTLLALVLFSLGQSTSSSVNSPFYLDLGWGGMERLIVAPVLLWAIVEGIVIARMPRFAPASVAV